MGVRLRRSVRHGLRYGVGAGVLAICLALKGEPPLLYFVLPRSPLVMSGPYGEDIPVSVHIAPRAENRAYSIAWCNGSTVRTLDGDNEYAELPERTDKNKPWTIRVYPGECNLVAAVFGKDADGQLKELRRVELRLKVCGGEDSCGGSK